MQSCAKSAKDETASLASEVFASSSGSTVSPFSPARKRHGVSSQEITETQKYRKIMCDASLESSQGTQMDSRALILVPSFQAPPTVILDTPIARSGRTGVRTIGFDSQGKLTARTLVNKPFFSVAEDIKKSNDPGVESRMKNAPVKSVPQFNSKVNGELEWEIEWGGALAHLTRGTNATAYQYLESSKVGRLCLCPSFKAPPPYDRLRRSAATVLNDTSQALKPGAGAYQSQIATPKTQQTIFTTTSPSKTNAQAQVKANGLCCSSLTCDT
jgi:hypothetical protein